MSDYLGSPARRRLLAAMGAGGLGAAITAGPRGAVQGTSVGGVVLVVAAASVDTAMSLVVADGCSAGVMAASVAFLAQWWHTYLCTQCCHTKIDAGCQSTCSFMSVPMSTRRPPQTQRRSASLSS